MAPSSTPKPSSSSSSSDPTPNSKFDVFLSFRGVDTRFSFTDHLFVGLEDRGIHTFRDLKLQRGGEIEQELLETIESSRFSIIVFSKRYADSKWCLGELTKIMECRKEKGQIVLPVFYHVDPSHVRKQSGCFEEAFARHEKTVDGEKVKRWRAAMIEAADIAGCPVIKDSGYESKPIKEITDLIFKTLPKLIPVEGHMVGMNLRLEKLKKFMNINADDIRVVGICGIGGIGKTTIAKMVYNDILCQFSGASFLEDVKSRSKCHNGRLQLLQELLRDIQGVANLELSSIHAGVDMIKGRLKSKKFLIVMDDVDHWDQVQTLIMSCIGFAPGSRIVITTRHKDLVDMCQTYGSSEVEVLPYEINALSDEEAVELFRWHAFKHHILEGDYISLSDNILKYAQGHPLALKVLGSSLRGKTTDEWKSVLDKLKKRPYKEINDLFRMSIDGLDYYEKEVLLDIACFFKGTSKDFATVILDSCDLYATCGMSILLDRCLITVVRDNKVEMHDLIQQTCWAIVREEYPKDPSKWSRLWDPKDIEHAFSAKKMKSIETICLDLFGSKEIQFTSEVFAKKKHMFAKMKTLRLLKVFNSDSHGHTRKKDKIRLPIDFEFPPNLKYLHWEDLESLPSNFDGRNIVAINFKSSNIKELWEEDKCLEKLKFIDLSDSQLLMKIPKLSSMPNLERLNLGGCKSFYEIHSSLDAFPKMKFLKELNFSGSRIKELPSSIGSLTSLEILNLSNCLLFEKFADIFENMGHLRILYLGKSGIKELPNSFGSLQSLETLWLTDCSNFEKFPEILSSMKSLKSIYLSGAPIKELPNGIGCLGALEMLSISNCSNLDKLPEFQSNMGRLVSLQASGNAIKELPISICHLTRLEDLYLSNAAIKELPISICHLTKLQDLDLRKSAIKELPCSIGHLGQLRTLNLEDCRNLASLPSSIYKLKSLRECSLSGCSNLEAFWEITADMEHLERLYFRGVGIIVLPSSIERLKNLTLLELNNCANLETLPDSNLTHLRTLLLHNCPKLHKLPDGLRSLQCCLEVLDISCCNLMEEAIPSDLWGLFSLVMLNLSENNIRCIPIGIIHLSHLNILLMNHCHMLQEIPELPSSLRRIEAHGCPCLETISSDSTHLLWTCLLNCFKSQIQDLVKRTYITARDLDICVQVTHNIEVVVPGSCGGIPEWVSHKSMGREIIIELPKNWYEDKNFLGFAFFFHHIRLDDDDNICKTLYYCFHSDDYDCKCKRILDSGHLNDCSSHVNIPQFNVRISDGYRQFEQVGLMAFEENCKSYSVNGTWYRYTNHIKGSTTSSNPALRVAYFPQIAIKREHRSNRWNKFQARFQGPFHCGDKTSFKVESCGIHLIYDDDDDAQDDDCQPFSLKRGCHDADDHLLAKRSRQL